MVEKGLLGDVTNVYAQWHRNLINVPSATWTMKKNDPRGEEANWRLLSKFSGGLVAELGSHQMDIADWMFGSHFESVTGVGGIDYFKQKDVPINRVGRDMPGSNWHVYPYDPEGHRNELYYGMEQVGWNGASKPKPMHDRGYRERPPLPQIPEYQEVNDAMARGDDFGSGYSSLGYLTRLPFNCLKIDRSFVSGIATAPEKRKLLGGIIALAHGLGMSVVAEGAELHAEVDLLTAFDCDFVQGYVFSRPVAAGEAVVVAEGIEREAR
mgnify:CR=1 FL=1